MAEQLRTVQRAGKRAQRFLQTLRNVGVPLDAGSKVLDLGCGAGRLVKGARELGLDFYGCGMDMRDHVDPADPGLMAEGVLREIPDPYRIPFDDCTFDAVISDQVFEHVMDYPTTISEIHRVLKPGGVFLHLFPPRSTPIEPHVFVPLATMVRARWWLKAWAMLGIRNQFQRKLTPAQAADANFKYLTSRTNYLPKRELYRQFGRHFDDVRFVEHAFLKATNGRARKLSEVPLMPMLYGALRNRVAFGRRPIANQRRMPG
jgi:SAM-dependent methyltransferase